MSNDPENVEGVCLFCLQLLPSPFNSSFLSGYGHDLSIRLDDSGKNKYAFNLLCSLLHIDFTKERRKAAATFDPGRCLPLCLKCQGLYQDVYHLHLQVLELDRQIKDRVNLITTLICESDDTEHRGIESYVTQLTTQGLALFREKVVNLRANINRKSSRKIKQQTKNDTLQDDLLLVAKTQIKTEPIKHEDNCISDLEDVTDLPWGEDVDFGSAFEDTTSLTELLLINTGLEETSRCEINLPASESQETRVTEALAADTHGHDGGRQAKEDDADDFHITSDDNDNGTSDSDSDSSYTVIRTRRSTRRISTRNRGRLPGENALTSKSIKREGHKVAPHECHLCHEIVYSVPSFRDHYKEKHPDEKKYSCKYCKMLFIRARSAISHQRAKHEKKRKKKPVSKNASQITIADTNNDSAVTQTENPDESDNDSSSGSDSSHRDNKKHSQLAKRSVIQKERTLKIAPRECHICNEIVYNVPSFRDHYKKKHPGVKKYCCKYCNRLFMRARDALSHQRAKHEKIILDPDKGEISGNELVLAVLDRDTGEFKPKKTYRKKRSRGIRRTDTDYVCHLCDEKIIGCIPLKNHYKEKHPEERRYTCKFCKRHFLRLRDVEGHQRKHTGERPYECEKCNRRFASKTLKQYHDNVYHNPNGKSFKCEKCSKLFATESLLKHHRETHNYTVVVCLTCGGTYISKLAFQNHNKKMHEGTAKCSDPIKDPSDKQLASLGVEIKGKLKCFICWKFLPGTRNVLPHFEQHHPDASPHQCPHCDKSTFVYKHMYKHVYRHKGSKTFQCDQCPRSFFTAAELNNHSKVHLADKEKFRHVCDTCGASFAAKHSLNQHSKKHDPDGDGPANKWICEICGRSYSDRKGYTQHKKSVHSANPAHKCPHCPKAFALLWELRKHINKHAAQKPFKCPHCDMRFSYTTSRRRHVKEIHQKIKVRRMIKPLNSQQQSVTTTSPVPSNVSGEPLQPFSISGQDSGGLLLEMPKEESGSLSIFGSSNAVQSQWGAQVLPTTVAILTFKHPNELELQELK